MTTKSGFSRFLEKLEVNHEPGLTTAQLFLRVRMAVLLLFVKLLL